MKNKKNITTVVLTTLCLILFITTLAFAESAAGAKAELADQETRLIEWAKNTQLIPFDYNAEIIDKLNVKADELKARIATLEQEKVDAYRASIEAINSYTASYNTLMSERDFLAGKLAESLTRAQVVRIVEVDKRILVDTEDWVSLAELEAFLDEDDTDEVLVFTANATFNSSCEDRAFQLRHRAFDIGKRLEMEALTPAEYKKWYDDTIASDRLHAICKAVIGNECWYIEPADDRHWIGAYLD